MTLSHELGHVVGGMISGGKLSALEIRPWHLPHSIFSPDPKPQVTIWAGPIIGTACPLLLALIAKRRALAFVGWFCALANAAYLLLGYFTGDPELDSAKLLRAGTPSYLLLLFAAMTGPLSYLKFRSECVDLMSGATDPMTKATWCWSAIALYALLTIQTLAGTGLSQ